MSRTVTVQHLLDLAEEFRRAGQLEPVRLAHAANGNIALLREAAQAAHKKGLDYQAKADNGKSQAQRAPGVGTSSYQVKQLTEDWKRASGLADAWRKNATGLTTAVGLILDRPSTPSTSNEKSSKRPLHQDGVGTNPQLLKVRLIAHLDTGTWSGQLRIQAIPAIGSGLRLDSAHLLRISDVEMDLLGTFTMYVEVAPAAPTPTRGLLTKLGLTQVAQAL